MENEKKKMNQSLNELKLKNDSLHHKNSEISQECSLLQQRIGVLSVVESQHNKCASRIKVRLHSQAGDHRVSEALRLQSKECGLQCPKYRLRFCIL